jgi:hypothetical protein
MELRLIALVFSGVMGRALSCNSAGGKKGLKINLVSGIKNYNVNKK